MKKEKKEDEVKKSRRRTSLKCLIIISSSVLLPALIIGSFMYNVDHIQRLEPIKYNDILKNEPSHKWLYLNKFLSKETSRMFTKLAQNEDPFSTINDLNVESAGESVPVGHVACRHPFMTLNLNRTMCHFSNRLDVGMHFVKTGGFNGHIEYFDRMVARIIPFRKRLLTNNGLVDVKEFKSEAFVNEVKSLCFDINDKSDNGHKENKNKNKNKNTKKEEIVNEMFQLDLLLMLPGQELPIHLNSPFFWGADRNSFPQWLLVVMKNSNLFDHLFIPQVQGISWLTMEDDDDDNDSDDNDNNDKDEGKGEEQNGFVEINGEGGDFYLYPYKSKKLKERKSDDDKEEETSYSDENVNKYVILRSIKNAAILLDGAQVMHGVDRFKPNDLPPLFSHNHHYTLKYETREKMWHLFDFEKNMLRKYNKNDVKLMLVWNEHCFANREDQRRFHSQSNDNGDNNNDNNEVKQLTLAYIMDVFKKDLKSRDRLPSDKIEPLELWTIVLKEYLKYPVNTHQQNSTIFGINYCLLPNLAPEWITKNILRPFLSNRC